MQLLLLRAEEGREFNKLRGFYVSSFHYFRLLWTHLRLRYHHAGYLLPLLRAPLEHGQDARVGVVSIGKQHHLVTVHGAIAGQEGGELYHGILSNFSLLLQELTRPNGHWCKARVASTLSLRRLNPHPHLPSQQRKARERQPTSLVVREERDRIVSALSQCRRLYVFWEMRHSAMNAPSTLHLYNEIARLDRAFL